jgi:hypothetical protein
MAKVSNVLPASRIKAPRSAEGGRETWIDGVFRDCVRSGTGAYYLASRPGKYWPSRLEAIDTLVASLMKNGQVGSAPSAEQGFRSRTVSQRVKIAVSLRDAGLCQYCLMRGISRSGTQFKHFIPVALNGTSDIDNVLLACADCNFDKRHTHPSEYFGPRWQDWAPGKPRPAG